MLGRLRKMATRWRKPAATPASPSFPAPALPGDDKTWQAGDMAECICTNGWFACVAPGFWLPADGPKIGRTYTVTGVKLSDHPQRGQVIYLYLKGWPGSYEAASFRKLQPVADKAQAADSTFLHDLNRRLSDRSPHNLPQGETV